ncbi:MAG: MATE family efflux transporter [bacterium]
MNNFLARKPFAPGGIREMLSIALPMVVSSACDTVMTFTDRLFLARLGPEQMNAAMAGGLTCFMLTTFFIGLTGYTTALAAQYLGAGRKDHCARAVTQSLLVCLAAYPVILACRPLGHAMFAVSGIVPEQLAPQTMFFDILLLGTCVSLARNSLSAFFSGIGRTRIVMLSAMTAMAVNVGANYILVFGKFGCPAMGIRGSACGTILGGICGLLVVASGYFAKRNRIEYKIAGSFRFDRAVMGKLLRYGSPAGLEFFLNLLAFNVLILAFHSQGLAAATAVTIVFNWDMVSFVPLIGVNIGVTSLVGRYMGAGVPDTAHRATMSGLKLAWMYALCALFTFSCFPKPLVEVFHPGGDSGLFETAAPMAVFMLRLVSIYVLADAMNLVFSGALRGAGDTMWAMTISVGLHWALVVIVVVLLRVAGLPVETAWSFLVFVILVFSGIFYLRYRCGKWRTIRMVQPAGEVFTPSTDGLHEPPDL